MGQGRLAGQQRARGWEGNRRREVMCWAMIGRLWASRFVKICRVPGDVVSESVRASQEEIWPLKGVDGFV